MKPGKEMTIEIQLNIKISFWQALKLRIAGKNIKSILEKILLQSKTFKS